MSIHQDEITVKVNGVWKRYGFPLPPLYYRTRHLLKSVLRRSGSDALPDRLPWALSDISFEAARGEMLGVIGRNGSGKSTLLKILAGVSPATHGQVSVTGHIFPMIELNAGMHLEFTGRENLYLLGSIMGFSRASINALLPKVEEFCELGDWFDQPVRMYSSGMLARLGFGIAMNMEADVVLVDEVLAVGDLSFQRKCFDRMAELRRSGATIIFVTHAIRQVELLCDKVILLEKGRIVKQGDTSEVSAEYYRLSNEWIKQGLAAEKKEITVAEGTGEIRIKSAHFLDENGQRTSEVTSRTSMQLVVEFQVLKRIENPHFGIGINEINGVRITYASTGDMNTNCVFEPGIGRFIFKIDNFPLLAGIYNIDVTIYHHDHVILVTAARIFTFNVTPNASDFHKKNIHGYFTLQGKWDFRQGSDL